MSNGGSGNGFYARFGKRGFDFVAATAGLLFVLPVLLVVAVVVAVKLGRPVLFVQQRSGLGGRPFRIVKFRSMLNSVDPEGRLLSDEARLPSFGRKLRSSSLDELPALWNVVKGEMSLVGPRPLHVHYDALYSPEQARRLLARPGITGWAQVNGRNALTWPDKFALDVWYVNNQGFWLDLKIIFATIMAVFRRSGISAEGAATMPEFKGDSRADD